MKKLLFISTKALLIAVPLLFISCKQTIKKNSQSKSEITEVLTLEKTECFGQCPIYKFSIYSDLTCKISPTRFAIVKSLSQSTVSQSEIDEILEFAKQIKFWSLEDEYDNKSVSDLPATILTINNNNQSKTIRSRANIPILLGKLNKKVSDIAENREWISIEKQ